MNISPYVTKTLYEGLVVITELLEKSMPFQEYTIQELGAMFPELDSQKLMRIIRTLQEVHWIEETNRKFRIGVELYMLSHKYMKKLEQEHNRIKSQINQFSIGGTDK